MRNPRATGLGRSGRTYSTAQLATGSEDVEDDASFGRARENPGADRGKDLPPGPGVAPAGHPRPPAHPLGGDLAAVRARLPADLLPLPAGLLPGLLAGAGRVRGAGAAREV